MAQVDFTNAVIEPAQGSSLRCVIRNPYVSFNYGNNIYDSSNQRIGSASCSVLTNEKKQLIFSYTGEFTASGTEFYITHTYTAWKISNISFNSGDTYTFQIDATLVCN